MSSRWNRTEKKKKKEEEEKPLIYIGESQNGRIQESSSKGLSVQDG